MTRGRAAASSVAGVLGVAAVFLLPATLLGASSGNAASPRPRATATVTRTVTATATVTRTVTATATVTAPGPTSTVTVPGPTVTVTGSPTSTATATATATATPTTPPPASCTSPVFSTSAAQGTYQAKNPYWVNNNAWSGGAGPQTLYVCSPSSWYVTSTQPDMGGQVQTYPDTQYNTNSSKTIAQYNSITSTFSEEFPAAGSWDAMYDIWLNEYSIEIMVWNEWTGSNLYWPSDKSTTVVLDGVPYWFQHTGTDRYVFFRQTMVKSGSVDLLAAMRYLVGRGLISGSDVPTQLEYGVEINSTVGTQTFPMTGLTFNLS